MNVSGEFQIARIRLLIFVAVAALHITLIMFVAFRMETAARTEEPVAGVMRLVDVEELIPPPPPPPERPPQTPQTNTDEAIAETMIETDEPPPPVTAPVPREEAAVSEQIEYLRPHQISVLPVLPEDQIVRNTVYPPIAQRSGIEGRVILELYIDRYGVIRDIRILQEDPLNRGFGEAAVNAFRGISGKPAEANGVPVAVRVRYPFRFTLR
jgi:protein TonB